MNKEKRKALEAVGFRFGDAADFLELTHEERMLVELRVKLAQTIRQRREQSNLSQKEVAIRIKSSQPRVAKIEVASSDVSLDQMFRGLFAVGGSIQDLTATKSPRRLKTPETLRPKGKKPGASV
jgi:predicted XRE-type DNA-binding protein